RDGSPRGPRPRDDDGSRGPIRPRPSLQCGLPSDVFPFSCHRPRRARRVVPAVLVEPGSRPRRMVEVAPEVSRRKSESESRSSAPGKGRHAYLLRLEAAAAQERRPEVDAAVQAGGAGAPLADTVRTDLIIRQLERLVSARLVQKSFSIL